MLDNLEFFKFISIFGNRTPSIQELITLIWTDPKLSFKLVYGVIIVWWSPLSY